MLLDMVVALSAVIISVASLYVALRADQTQERLLQSTVWPYVQYDTSDATATGTRRLAFELTNAGVGPAIIRSFSLAYDGHYVTTVHQLLTACCMANASKSRHGVYISTVRDRVIMAHEVVQFIQAVPQQTEPATYTRLSDARSHVTIRLCYCSVLGDCWLIDSALDGVPHSVSACIAGKTPEYIT